MIEYGQEQPLSVRLAPAGTTGGGSSDLHSKILGRINARRMLSERAKRNRFEAWSEVDDSLRMFVDLSRKAVRGDGTKDPDKVEMPFQRAIVIPLSFAIHQVRLAQLLGLYLHREPPLQVEGRSPEDISGSKLVEAALAYDTEQSGYPTVMNSFLQDADRYGVGAIYDSWEMEEGLVYPPRSPMLDILRKIGLLPRKTWGTMREYNRWATVDPYLFFPDPRIPLSNIQEGEFVGHRFFRGFSYLKEKQMQPGKQPGQRQGIYFNVDEALKRSAAGGSRTSLTSNRFRAGDFAMPDSTDDQDKGYYALDHMQIKLVPKLWELSEGDRPEIWWFTVADETTIIRAHPCPYDHGDFSYAAAEVNPDPHVIQNPGMVELLQGIQRLVNWLYNSHVENARKILNDSLIVAPSLIEMADLLNPKPARHIRLTGAGEELVKAGRDARQFAVQLQVSDITKGHMQTAGSLLDFAQRMAASNDPAQGQPLEEKRTLGEVQSIIAASSARLAITARLIDSMAMQPLCRRAVSNRQQLTSMQQWFRIAGDLAKVEETQGMQRIQIDRWDLQGSYDYIAHSAMLPADPARQAELWIRLLAFGASYPVLMDPQQSPDGYVLDVRKIFNTAARQAGARNIQEFYRQIQPQVQVQPDAAVAAGVQAGNMLPMNTDPRAAAMAATAGQAAGQGAPLQ